MHWAHANADRFPDGQLYVNLRGFDPTGTPVPPAIAMRGFLTALGISAQHIPADLDEQLLVQLRDQEARVDSHARTNDA